MGIDRSELSPAVQQRVVYAGTVARSFAEASDLLQRLADLPLATKAVERLTRRIGAERVAERTADVAAFTSLPLVDKFAVPADVTPPEVAVVMVDGGRLQIRDAADAIKPGTNPAKRVGHWREDKIGLLLTMQSGVHEHDPCPEILPAAFLDATRIPRLVRELKPLAAAGEDAAADSPEPELPSAALAEEPTYQPPVVLRRQLLASRDHWSTLGDIVACAARAAGFQGAARKVFVADGSANNWAVQQRFFGSFVPVLNFIHALSYVFAAAVAGRPFAAGWAVYRQWIQWVWQGNVAQVITALEGRVQELGEPTAEEPTTSPRQVVQRTLTYLRNHQEQRAYASYRQQGLPLTSSLMESAVKQVNQRVKGSEKFWSEAGAEALLQLRADHLSDGAPLEAFWSRREVAATGQRRYRRAS
ncbi:MAG: hypothetical protein K2R98_30685 [Gemmataceae bacterium]|nr:hypothetical protein [Gemmataceae bacterium]